MSKSLQEMPNSRSWYRGGPKESQLLTLVTSTDSLTKSSRMSIETSNCWSILFLPSREIKSFIKTSCCRSSTKLDDECKARRVIPLVYDFLLIRAESRQAGRPAASSPPGDLHQRPLHRWWSPRKPSFPCSRERAMSFTLWTSLIWRQRRRNWRASRTGIPRRYCRRRECKLTSVISKAVIFNSCLPSETV